MLRKVELKDSVELHNICIEAYAQNFHNHWNPGGLEWYLEREFNLEKLSDEISQDYINYFLIEKEGSTIGFVKLNFAPDLPEIREEDAIELEKIYILPDKKGKGVGSLIISQVLEIAKGRDKKTIFLLVLDTNFYSIQFYKKMGFSFHSKTKLNLPYFIEELKGMDRMYLNL